jgi:outer membrane protein assembly factor BamB
MTMAMLRSASSRIAVALAAIVAATGVGGAAGATNVGWRYDGSGRYPASAPPTRWSKTDGVLWRTPLPTWGNASPVVVGDRVFVQAEPASLLCLRASDGALLWTRDNPALDTLSGPERATMEQTLAAAQAAEAELDAAQKRVALLKRAMRKKAGAGGDPKAELAALNARMAEIRKSLDATSQFRTPPADDTIGYASSTPVSDGTHVYALFRNGVAAAYDMNGDRRWIRWLGRTPRMNGNPEGHAASPLLVGGRLIVPFGVLQALDPADGLVVWISSVYRDFGSPIATRAGGVDVVVSPDGRVLRAKDGQPVATGLAQVFYVGPVADPTTLYFAGNPSSGGATMQPYVHAFRLGALGSGPKPPPLWTTALETDRYYGAPLAQDGVLYTISVSGRLLTLDATTGERLYDELLAFHDGKPSLASAGPNLYVSDSDGRTVVYRRDRRPERIADNLLEPFRATPFFAGASMYVRTHTALYRIGR